MATTALLALALTTPGRADERVAQAQPAPETRAFDIPAQPLANALNAFGRQAGVQVTMDGAATAGIQAQAVSGRFTPDEALRRLLAGTGVAGRFTGSRTVLLVKRPQQSGAIALDPVTVEGATRSGGAGTGGDAGYNPSKRISRSDILPVEIEKQPRSISVLGADLLDQQQNNSLGVVLRNTPSVSQTANGEGTSFIATRGFSASVLVDGQYAPNVNRSLAAYDSIEVHKGPDALLFGGGTPGGAVNFVLKRPKEQAENTIVVGTGFEDKLKNGQAFATLDMTGPVSDTVSYRLVLDGIRENKFYAPTDADKSGMVYGVLEWKATPDSKLTAFLIHDRRDYNSASLAGQPTSGTVLANPNGIRIPIEQVYTDPDYRYTPNNTTARLEWQQALGDAWTWDSSLQGQWHDEFRAISYPSALSADRTRVTVGLSRYLEDWTQTDLDVTSRLTGRFDVATLPNLLVGGVQYRSQDYHSPRSQSGSVVVSLVNPNLDWSDSLFTATAPGSDATLRQKSVFVQDQLSLTRTLNLIGGLRYDAVDQTSQSTAAGAAKLSSSQNKISWNAGLVWEAVPGLNLYGSVNTAFEPTSPGSTDQSGRLFAPQETRQYEAGLKYNVTPALFATAAVFDITRTNVLTPDPVNALFSVQTGEVRSRGFELELTGELSEGWKLLAAFTHLDPEITKDTVNRGRTLANIPRNAARLFSTYRIGEGPLRGVGFGGGMTHRSSRYADNANTLPLPSYTLFDALAWYEVGEKSRVQLNAANLFDKEFYANGRNALRVYPGTPRTVLLSFKSSF